MPPLTGATTVTAAAGNVGAGAPRALVFLLGLSGELPDAHFDADFDAVLDTVSAAIDGLDEHVRFAVVAGSEYARMVYPDTMRLARAGTRAKAEARAALARVEPIRAAAFGRWIRMADRLFSACPDAIRTAVLLMDLKATAEHPDEPDAALASCRGRFSCHVRGIGTNWEVSQGRAVAAALAGTVDLVAAPASPTGAPRSSRTLASELASGLASGLASIIEDTRRAFALDLALRITAPTGVRVRFLKLVRPALEDLTGRGSRVGPGVTEYPIDVPDHQSRDYHLALALPPGEAGEEYVAAHLDVVLLPPAGDGQSLARRPVRVCRDSSEDRRLPGSRVVTRYTGQAELAEAIQSGLEALRLKQPPPAQRRRPLARRAVT